MRAAPAPRPPVSASRARRRRGYFGWAPWPLLAGALALSCSGSEVVDPASPTFSEDARAQIAFQELRRRWEDATPEGRKALILPLTKFETAYSKDPTARSAKAMRSLLVLLQEDVKGAERLATQAFLGDPGATRDMAIVALGGVLRRRDKPAAALRILKPLHNRIVDEPTRTILNTELAKSAVAVGNHRDAVIYARTLVTQANFADLEAAKKTAAAIFESAPPDALRALLAKTPEDQREPRELFLLIVARLADIAEQTRDLPLARFLISDARALLGERVDNLSRLITRDRKVRIEQNTIGLLMPLRRPELERKGIEVAQGLTYAVGLPGSAANLLTRDDGGDPTRIEEALALLAGDGAAVIVAGFDRQEASIAKAFAERSGIAVLLLTEPNTEARADGPVFALGPPSTQVRGALLEALRARQKSKVALVVGDQAAPTGDSAGSFVAIQPCGASTEFLAGAGADSVIVDADESCARGFASGLGAKTTLALTFDAPRGLGALQVDAGSFAADRARATGSLARYHALGRNAPTWWTALGHDAGVLAWAAVQKLAPAESDDAATIASRKREVLVALEGATDELWTTDARGFAGTRMLDRTISVRAR